jgi:hypothetical protein
MATRTNQSAGSRLAFNWLEHGTREAGVLATARQLLALQGVLKHQLPPALGNQIRVASVNRQHLTLAVPAAAYASKIRQLAPSLLRAANDAGWNLSGISVRIQADLASGQTKLSGHTRDIQPLDEQALESFRQLHQSVQPGPLADAIARLLRHHRG